ASATCGTAACACAHRVASLGDRSPRQGLHAAHPADAEENALAASAHLHRVRFRRGRDVERRGAHQARRFIARGGGDSPLVLADAVVTLGKLTTEGTESTEGQRRVFVLHLSVLSGLSGYIFSSEE